jgi:HAD superfamily hydrolase (TIGR01459 family)
MNSRISTILCLFISVTISLEIERIGTLQGKYDFFVLDQWGVLHDGKKAYPGALECIKNLRSERGKKIVLLSNSSKRKSACYRGLEKVGFGQNLFDDVVTSGEIGWNAIFDREISFLDKRSDIDGPIKVFVIGNGDDDKEYIESAGCVASGPEECQFALARGMFSFSLINCEEQKFPSAEQLLAKVDPVLSELMSRSVPLLITNPDMARPGSGAPMPGVIGSRYEKLGGSVEYVGKPHAKVYGEVCRALDIDGGDLSVKKRLIGIGDSLEHDIMGANNFGINSAFIANGVHCSLLGTSEGSSEKPRTDKLQMLFNKFGTIPTHSVASFTW